MQKKLLKFKVEGGLEKVVRVYSDVASEAAEVVESYGATPEILLEKLTGVPSLKAIKISSGYKKLAASLEAIDFRKLQRAASDASDMSEKEEAFTSLWHAVGEYDAPMQLTNEKTIKSSFTSFSVSVSVAVSVVAVAVAVATASLSGKEERPDRPSRSPQPNAPKFSACCDERIGGMLHYARTVADQIGWFSV